MSDTQISAYISKETRDKIERYADAHGLKKGALVEQALLHHLQALHELPADIIIPPRIELSEASLDKVARLIARPRKPTKAMRALISRRP
jgi:uncharacterized protein (DUF1778 family)